MTVGIIGCGNMGSAIAQSATKAMFGVGAFDQEPGKVTDASVDFLMLDRVTAADLVVLAVKPQQFSELAEEMRKVKIGETSVIVSIMAGVPIGRIRKTLNTTRVVRAMPNLAARVQESMTVWIADPSLSEGDRANARALFTAMGKEIEVQDEAMIDAATIAAGCGPGWLYHILADMQTESERLGFSPDQAALLIRQMFVGAALTMRDDQRSFAELSRAVASKGGVTEAGIACFEEHGLSGIIQAVYASTKQRLEQLR